MRGITDIRITDSQWEETGYEDDPRARLLTTVCINGVHHHLEAFAIKTNDKTHVQEAVAPAFEDNLNGICEVSEPDGRWQTVHIKKREYALAMTPFC